MDRGQEEAGGGVGDVRLKGQAAVLVRESKEGGDFALGITGSDLLLHDCVRTQAGAGGSSNELNFLGQLDCAGDGESGQEEAG